MGRTSDSGGRREEGRKHIGLASLARPLTIQEQDPGVRGDEKRRPPGIGTNDIVGESAGKTLGLPGLRRDTTDLKPRSPKPLCAILFLSVRVVGEGKGPREARPFLFLWGGCVCFCWRFQPLLRDFVLNHKKD